MAEDIEIRRKRLLHRSRYTGIKETDILLGAFAEAHLPTFDEGQLDRYEALLESGSDLMIYAWTVGAKPVPPEYANDIMALLKAFKLKV